jgi:NAD(P)-dependent dehydrogenase (short-subunit alcohol dehydrogenase family)
VTGSGKAPGSGGPVAGKVAVVAGGSTGLGAACGRALAQAGARVALLARQGDRLDKTVADIAADTGAAGGTVCGIVADIADPDSVRRAFSAVAGRYGPPGILLNVASVTRIRTIEEASDEDIAAVLNTNLLGPIHTTRAAIPLMRGRGGGDIVSVSSEATLDYLPLGTLYATSKWGLDGLTRQLVHELRPDGIRVTLVRLGATKTEWGANNYAPGEAERARGAMADSGYMDRVAGRTHMDAGQVAETILFVITRPATQMSDVIHIRARG